MRRQDYFFVGTCECIVVIVVVVIVLSCVLHYLLLLFGTSTRRRKYYNSNLKKHLMFFQTAFRRRVMMIFVAVVRAMYTCIRSAYYLHTFIHVNNTIKNMLQKVYITRTPRFRSIYINTHAQHMHTRTRRRRSMVAIRRDAQG